MSTVIKIENLSKHYRLGLIGGGTLREDVSRWIAKARGKPDPLLKVDQPDHGNRKGGQIWALRDINLEVQEGEILGIIGRNGAGKSTLLKILSKITAPTTGRVKIKGRVGSLLEVGTGFHPELTGRENIYLNGTILGMSRAEIEKKFDEIVAFAEIEKFLETPVKRYSSGMYVRLAFAVAAHLEPEILLVDEVLAVGDAEFQKKCLGKMGEVAQAGRTVLFVSHNMVSILNLCSQAILLGSGRITACGIAQQVISDYLAASQETNVFQPRPKERLGNQAISIHDFQLNPSSPKTGMPLEFIFDIFRSDSERKGMPVELAVTVLTDQGVKLLQLYSRHMDVVFSITSGHTRIVAKLESLPLAPGDYWLNLWIGAGKTVFDWHPECLLLSVSPGNLSSEAFVDNRGYPVVVSSFWQVITKTNKSNHFKQ